MHRRTNRDRIIPLITVQPIKPESPEFYLNSTPEQWRARMIEKYGPDFEESKDD